MLNFTLDNLRYFATLRAMGVSSFRLIAMVGSQVFTVTSISFGLGVGLAAYLNDYDRTLPQYRTELEC